MMMFNYVPRRLQTDLAERSHGPAPPGLQPPAAPSRKTEADWASASAAHQSHREKGLYDWPRHRAINWRPALSPPTFLHSLARGPHGVPAGRDPVRRVILHHRSGLASLP
jgi:hypothetical protein